MNKEKYILDFTNVKGYFEMHAIIKETLEFPDYYGCNWSAFWDCLSEIYDDFVHIEIIGIEVIESKFDDAAEKMIKILKRFKREGDDFLPGSVRIDIIREDGSVTTIE